MSATINIYLMYTNEDGTNLLQLLRHLDPLKKNAKVHFWYDDPIYPSNEWSPQIVSRFEDADIYLLLLSNNFMHSKFVEQVEFKMIIDKYKAGKSKVIPIVLENCPWDVNFESEEYTFNFNQLKVLPKADKPISEWSTDDGAYEVCRNHISTVISSLIPQGFTKITRQGEGIESTEKKDQLELSFLDKKEAEEKVKEELRIKEAFAQERALQIEEEPKSKEAEKARLKNEKEKENQAEIENQRRIEEEEWLRERMEANPEIEMGPTVTIEDSGALEDEAIPDVVTSSSKKVFLALGSAAAVIALIAFLSWPSLKNNTVDLTQQPDESIVDKNSGQVEKSIDAQNKSTTIGAGGSVSELSVGNSFQNGIVFEVLKRGNRVKIASTTDLGPMTWKEGMAIHDKLGEGWRLPSMEELTLIYKTIGPGADNSGQFTNELYWSATPYDASQAKLVRFSDGNGSYHYNSKGDFRKFLVRAVREVEK